MKPHVEWEDLVFENRNREYGAYDLRRAYGRRLAVAFIITAFAVGAVMAYPSVVGLFEEKEQPIPIARTVKYTDLAAPPPIDKETPPPPKLDIPPPVREAIKFLPPKVTDKEVEEEIPTVEELKIAEVAPETLEGDGTIIFDDPVEEATQEEGEDPNKIYLIVEQQPEFPGGTGAMMKFVAEKMKYPPQARRMGIDGSVFVSFVVSADGSITDAQVIKGIGAGCDQEAVRVIQSMPPWKPGKQGGRPVKVRFVLPIKFRLS